MEVYSNSVIENFSFTVTAPETYSCERFVK